MSPTAGAARLRAALEQAIKDLPYRVYTPSEVRNLFDAALSPIETTAGVPISDERSADEEREMFFEWHHDFTMNCGHTPSHLDVWLMARGVMDTNGKGLAASPVQKAEQ